MSKTKLNIIFISNTGGEEWRVAFKLDFPANCKALGESLPTVCLSRQKNSKQSPCWFALDALQHHNCMPSFYEVSYNNAELSEYVNRVVKDVNEAVATIDREKLKPQGFQVGDKVKIKSTVTQPMCGWGNMKYHKDEVGVITDAGYIYVDFPCQSFWIASAEELEKVYD